MKTTRNRNLIGQIGIFQVLIKKKEMLFQLLSKKKTSVDKKMKPIRWHQPLHFLGNRQIGRNDNWSKRLINCRLIKSTWKVVEVSNYETYTNVTNQIDLSRKWKILEVNIFYQTKLTQSSWIFNELFIGRIFINCNFDWFCLLCVILHTFCVSASWSVDDGETLSSSKKVSGVNCDPVSFGLKQVTGCKGRAAAQQLVANNWFSNSWKSSLPTINTKNPTDHFGWCNKLSEDFSSF